MCNPRIEESETHIGDHDRIIKKSKVRYINGGVENEERDVEERDVAFAEQKKKNRKVCMYYVRKK